MYTVTGSVNEILTWEEMGIKIEVPAGIIKPAGSVCDIAIVPLLYGEFLFPIDTVAVSGIYAIGTSCPIKKPITIHIQHCVNLRSEGDLQAMSFYKAEHSNTGPPYEFLPCDGGVFATGSNYASLECKSFTLYAIARTIRSWITGRPDPTICYRAQVLYVTSTLELCRIIYVFVIKNINSIIQVSQLTACGFLQHFIDNIVIIIKGYLKDRKHDQEGPMVLFYFEDNKVVFELSGDTDNSEWEILPQQFPCEVGIDNSIIIINSYYRTLKLELGDSANITITIVDDKNIMIVQISR